MGAHKGKFWADEAVGDWVLNQQPRLTDWLKEKISEAYNKGFCDGVESANQMYRQGEAHATHQNAILERPQK